MKAWCIRWKKGRALCTVTVAHVLAVFPTREAARAFQVHGTVVVPITLPDVDLQPIKTAPRDGTWVLIYDSGEMNTKYSPFEVCRWRSVGRTHHNGPGWYNSQLTKQQRPTHWSPLPNKRRRAHAA